MRGRSESSPDPDPKKQQGGALPTMKHIPVCAQHQDQLLANGDANESDGKGYGRQASAQPEPILPNAGIASPTMHRG